MKNLFITANVSLLDKSSGGQPGSTRQNHVAGPSWKDSVSAVPWYAIQHETQHKDFQWLHRLPYCISFVGTCTSSIGHMFIYLIRGISYNFPALMLIASRYSWGSMDMLPSYNIKWWFMLYYIIYHFQHHVISIWLGGFLTTSRPWCW